MDGDQVMTHNVTVEVVLGVGSKEGRKEGRKDRQPSKFHFFICFVLFFTSSVKWVDLLRCFRLTVLDNCKYMLQLISCVWLLSNESHLMCRRGWEVGCCSRVPSTCHLCHYHWTSFLGFFSETLLLRKGKVKGKRHTKHTTVRHTAVSALFDHLQMVQNNTLHFRACGTFSHGRRSPLSLRFFKLRHLRNTFVPVFKFSFSKNRFNAIF